MRIFIVRHGEAAPAGPGGDGERALTGRGTAQAAAAAGGLRAMEVRLDRVLTSPLRRARETAALLAAALAPEAAETAAVLDGRASPQAILDELSEIGAEEQVALVGHMPGLGELVALAAAGIGSSGVALGTASVACLEFEGRPRPGAGRLRWLLTAEQLGRIAAAEVG